MAVVATQCGRLRCGDRSVMTRPSSRQWAVSTEPAGRCDGEVCANEAVPSLHYIYIWGLSTLLFQTLVGDATKWSVESRHSWDKALKQSPSFYEFLAGTILLAGRHRTGGIRHWLT